MDYFQTLLMLSIIPPKFGGNATELESWIEDAVHDVAFSLRRHKFQANDLRYRSGKGIPLYLQFPDPPLRKTHWQVARRCEKSFTECLKYLWESLKQVPLNRETNPFAQYKNWSVAEREAKNKDCLRLATEVDTTLQHFKSTMDKFQWFVSASYYMCGFTYQQEPALGAFKERCDNFAGCLNENGLFENEDIRAMGAANPFACALYSFCPDPCCDNRVLTKMEDCKITPCGENSGPCMANPDENKDWDSMINNEWNVTCPCPDFGTRWDSQSGICVDVDECLEEAKCNQEQNCVNLVGGYDCVCAFGFKLDDKAAHCELDGNLELIFQQYHHNLASDGSADGAS